MGLYISINVEMDVNKTIEIRDEGTILGKLQKDNAMASAELSGGGVSLMGSRGWRIVRLPSTRLSIMQNNSSQIQKALMVFKSLNGLVPEYLTSKFVTRNVSNYALRDSANKLVPFPRTNYMKNSCCEFRSRT